MENIDKIVMVRAYKKFIPTDRLLRPSCEEQYLRYMTLNNYTDIISDIMKEKFKNENGRALNVWNDDDFNILKQMEKEYLPFSSTYVSTLSFSLNGLVHDDMNNFFSDYKVAILEPLLGHEDELNYVCACPNDFTIKGRVNLSDRAILVVSKDRFESLSDEEKNNLNSIFKIEVFEGDLNEAVSKTLIKYGYPSVSYINSRERNYIKDGDFKQDLLDFVQNFSQLYQVSTLRLFDLYTSPFIYEERDKICADKVNDEFKKINIVVNYYQEKWYKFLVSKCVEIGVYLSSDELDNLYYSDATSKEPLSKMVNSLIGYYGYDRYKLLVREYNNQIKENYVCNEEIVNEASRKL